MTPDMPHAPTPRRAIVLRVSKQRRDGSTSTADIRAAFLADMYPRIADRVARVARTGEAETFADTDGLPLTLTKA